jgi:hypothetical protein
MSDANTTPAVYGQFGQALGLAERTLSAILRTHLAERGTEPEAWYALQLIATRGPSYPRAELIEALEGPNFGAAAIAELLDRLVANGLVRGKSALDLTPEGISLHADLRAYIAGPSTRLLSQFKVDDLETTVRTLRAITERALLDESHAA